MTTPGVSFGFEPEPAVLGRRARRLSKALEKTEAPLRAAVRTVMIPSIKQNFEVGGRPRWVSLSEFTTARRGKYGTGTKILDVTGKLKQEATTFRAWVFLNDSAVLSTKNFRGELEVIGSVHQGGSNRTGRDGTVRVPARPFLKIQPQDSARIRALMIQWMGAQGKRFWATGF